MAIGYLQIKGSGPCNAVVGVFDKDDNRIAECQSDARGFWCISSVPMEAGSHQIRAKMRAEGDREYTSNLIDVIVDDPDADVDIAAEVLDPALVAEMEEIDAESQERAVLRAACEAYENLLAQSVAGFEVTYTQLAPVLRAMGTTRDQFMHEVTQLRMRQTYSRLVCTAAAGITLEERDKKSVWNTYRKTEEHFAADVARAAGAATTGWQASLVGPEDE